MYVILFYDISRIFHYSVSSVISADNLTLLKRDN